MTFTITKAQRDALYDQRLDRLSGIGDIEVAVQAKNFDAAKRLTGEYSDELRLLADLGFGDGNNEPVDLHAPPDVLGRVLSRMREWAERYTASQESEQAEARELDERNRLVADTCEALLSDLDVETGETGARQKRGS
jgi:hypothetical protein